MMQRGKAITLDQKIRYLREIENIHRLSKKVLPPKGKTWAQIADQHLHRALGLPIAAAPVSLNVRQGRMHHLHSPRTARVVERTLKNGILHPDLLHHYRGDNVQTVNDSKPFVYNAPQPKLDTPDVIHYVQHGTDLGYPQGHLQGFGFVPMSHEVASHVQLESAGEPESVVPTAAGPAYH